MTRPLARLDDVPRGILLMIAATVLFAISNAIAKWEVGLYSAVEVLVFRSLSTFAVVALFLLPAKGFAVYRTAMPGAHLARGLSQSVSQALTVLALGLLPLASATAIGFSAPLFAALAAVVVLREKVTLERGLFLVLGFVGVLIVTRPSLDASMLGVAFALGNAVMYGSVTTAVRGMSRTESADTLLIWQASAVAAFHGLAPLVLGARMPALPDVLLLVGCGVANAAAQYCWTRSLVLAPATAVSPFYYLLLGWSALVGFLVWGDVPTPALMAGVAVIVASGLLVIVFEKRAKARPAPSGGVQLAR